VRPTPARSAGVLAALSMACVLLLSACGNTTGPSEEGDTRGNYEVVNVDTPDGTVTCVIWDGQRAGNIDCNWEGMK
jgi:hypothetical protein